MTQTGEFDRNSNPKTSAFEAVSTRENESVNARIDAYSSAAATQRAKPRDPLTRSGQATRRAFSKMFSDRAPATQPIPMAERLRGTPFVPPQGRQGAAAERGARVTLQFAADVAEVMLASGAQAAEVEVAAVAVVTSGGLDNVDLDVVHQSVSLHYGTPDGDTLTVIGVNRSATADFSRLIAVHQLVSDLVEDRITQDEGRRELMRIKEQPRVYKRWVVTVAWGVMSGALVFLLGGGILGSGLGIIAAVVNDRIGRRLAKLGVPYFFIVIVGAGLITTVAMILSRLGVNVEPQYVVGAGLIILLPTMTLVSAVQDAVSEYPITAGARLIQVVLSIAAIVAGIAIGLQLGQLAGLADINVVFTRTTTLLATSLTGIAATFIVSVMTAITSQNVTRLLVPSGLIGVQTFLVAFGLEQLGFDPILRSAIATALAAIVAHVVAKRHRAPIITMIIPGIIPLFPGLSIFAGVYQIVNGESGGPTILVGALFTTAALAIGAVFGTFLAQRTASWRQARRGDSEHPELAVQWRHSERAPGTSEMDRLPDEAEAAP